MDGALTEAEFRAFSMRLFEFTQELMPNERLFLMAVLARACARPESDLDPFPGGPGGAVLTDLAYSVWQSMCFPHGATSVNPQPVPFIGEKR